MAAKGKAKKAAAPKRAPAKKKDKDAPAGSGHNLTQLKRVVESAAARYNKLLDDKESQAGEIMSSVKDLIEESANKAGCKRKHIRQALQEQRADKKKLAAEQEMEPGDLEELESLRDALGLFGDTPLAQAALQREDAKTE